MFENHLNTLCVHGGWLYKEANILTKNSYNNYVRRGPFRVVRKGGGKNSPALIAWASIHPHYQQQIIDQFGDPTKTSDHIIFRDYLERDPKAIQFYSDYTLRNGKAIENEKQRKYAAEAAIFNAVDTVLNNRILRTRALGSGGTAKSWISISGIIQDLPRHTWPHGLKKNWRSLRRKYKKYLKKGYEGLIHGGHGHKNSEKINDDAKTWVIARYSDCINRVANFAQLREEYNTKAIVEGWKLITEEKTLEKFLKRPEIKAQWYGHRFGELASKEKYQFQHSTKMPSMRDSLWYSDGTKLNLYYKNKDGKMDTCQVYEVMDAYSEVFLGYHISKTEDYQAQYHAFKMAAQVAGHRPYEIRFDNQGGHKKLTAGNFLSKIAHLAISTQPYNGKSKSIESAFGRFQQQILKKHWFFTGQNITAKKVESGANMEFILANAKNLPTLEQVIETYESCRAEWNQKPHYATGIPRIDMYYQSSNPKTTPISLWEMVDIFWIERKLPVTLHASGLTFTEKNIKYTYMVYDEDRMPDLDFLKKNIDRKFFIKFDPDDMSRICLYEKTPIGLRFVTEAETKIRTARAIQEQESWEASYYAKVNKMVKDNREEMRNSTNTILEKYGMLPEQNGLNSPKIKGIESKRKRKERSEGMDIGSYQKSLSNKVTADLDDNRVIKNIEDRY